MEQFEKERELNSKQKEYIQQLSTQMENILVENRLLRKLAKVPDNYGFNLEEIKLAEKQKIEDYKIMVNELEREVEDLEAERTQLRK